LFINFFLALLAINKKVKAVMKISLLCGIKCVY